MAGKTLTVEVDNARNAPLFFGPLQSRVRGRFDARRAADNDSGADALKRTFPDPIPGQRIRLDLANGSAEIIEPLNDPEFQHIREMLEKRGHRIGQGRQIDSVDVATFAYWIGRSVEAGHCRIIDGELPKSLPGEPQRSFLTRRQPSETDRLADALDRQTEAFTRLADLMAKVIARDKANS
jgi:hypothetical protein